MNRRHVVKVNNNGDIAVVDEHIDLFGKTRFTAGVIREELRPVTMCKTFGVFCTKSEAMKAAIDNLTQQETKTEG